VDVGGYAPQAYEHDMKLWWVHTEAIVSAIKLYRITRQERYWDDFVRLTDYAFSHFRDAEYGEWYGYLHRTARRPSPSAKATYSKVRSMFRACMRGRVGTRRTDEIDRA
jgi:N-acylglucosamine 2-epimerase